VDGVDGTPGSGGGHTAGITDGGQGLAIGCTEVIVGVRSANTASREIFPFLKKRDAVGFAAAN
jgi:hypothetical protein